MGSSSARGLDISIASEHCRSSSASRADIKLPGPAYGCPKSTSASPGRHSASSGWHICLPAGIYVSRPTYVGPGSTPTLLGRHISFSGQNIHLWADTYRFRPTLAGVFRIWAGTAKSRLAWASAVGARCRAGSFQPDGLAPSSSWPAHPGLPSVASPGRSDLRSGPLARAAPAIPADGWAPAGSLCRRRSRLGRSSSQLSWAAGGSDGHFFS
jgi:hypothetical protein